MDALDSPESVDGLYASWGEDPSFARPLMQGDVFFDVTLPGISNEPQRAQIVMHPCNMRRGANLVPRVTMVPVSDYTMQAADWQKRVRIMPLPEISGAGSSNAMADLLQFTSVASNQLSPSKRIAALSDAGLLLLQQRLVFTQTRILLSLDRLHEQMSPTFTELELQEDWVEEALALAGDSQRQEVLEQASKDFQSWLDEDNRSRRSRLQNVREHSRIRREARTECLERYT
ncbi:hypothetical protein ACH4MN_25350 [Streptomyces anulatus]